MVDESRRNTSRMTWEVDGLMLCGRARFAHPRPARVCSSRATDDGVRIRCEFESGSLAGPVPARPKSDPVLINALDLRRMANLLERFEAFIKTVRGFESIDELLKDVHLEGKK
jgi:hypothetical protein